MRYVADKLYVDLKLHDFGRKEERQLIHATSNLGIWFNRKIGLYLKDLVNPKDNADLIPNCL